MDRKTGRIFFWNFNPKLKENLKQAPNFLQINKMQNSYIENPI